MGQEEGGKWHKVQCMGMFEEEEEEEEEITSQENSIGGWTNSGVRLRRAVEPVRGLGRGIPHMWLRVSFMRRRHSRFFIRHCSRHQSLNY